jgi:hypothetical protein
MLKNALFWDVPACDSCRNESFRGMYRLHHQDKRISELDTLAVKNADFWGVTKCASCKNRGFGGMYRLHHQGEKNLRVRNNVSSN